jgi:hypothetical protein
MGLLLPAEITMKSIQSIIVVLGVISVLFLIPMAGANTALTHDVTITTIDDTYSFEEQITISQDNESIFFTVPSDVNDLSVIINSTDITPSLVGDNSYRIDYPSGIESDQTKIIIKYIHPKLDGALDFEKEFTVYTEEYTVTFDNNQLTSAEKIDEGTSLGVVLREEQIEKSSLNLYTTILIALLVVLVIVTSAYGIMKRKNGVKRDRSVESSELLTTEKILLMDVLKEIEKKHRDQKISDETYQKLKSHYKQQTVEIMSSLED